jgi:RNA recognition motif-containing protein
MAKKLYVGNLPYQTQDQDLHDLFSQVGEVISARIVTDRASGRSKGFGFVEMTEDGAAEDSISRFNGQDYQGRALKVSEAKPQEDRPRRSGGGGFGGGKKPFFNKGRRNSQYDGE